MEKQKIDYKRVHVTQLLSLVQFLPFLAERER